MLAAVGLFDVMAVFTWMISRLWPDSCTSNQDKFVEWKVLLNDSASSRSQWCWSRLVAVALHRIGRAGCLKMDDEEAAL